MTEPYSELRVIYLSKRGDTFARWLLLKSERLLLPDRHGLTLRVGSRPWRARLELYRGIVMYYRGPQDGPADAGVADALTEHEENRSRNGDDSHDLGTGGRRQWFEKMESVFHISNCIVACQIKFATCTLQGNDLTWWNSHVRTVEHDVAYAMTWKTLKKMMTDKYCPRGEIKKLEIKLCNLKVKGTDVESYSQHFQELALMCSRMFLEESNEVEKYVGGLPDMIPESVMASRPKKMQDAIEFATELMDQKISTLAERQAKNKRKEKETNAEDLNLCNPKCHLNATTIMMDNVLPSAPTARGLAIWPGTVEASLLLPTTREPKGKIKEFSLALSVELRGISRVIA
ncbi:reverse transcriptase domain-containing protein [Tanacetum coccineum]